MDENRLDGSFRDELGLAIEAAMGVEPAPELKVHVHARIDRERATVRRWTPWRLASVGTAALLIAAVALALWRRDREQTVFSPDIVAVHSNTLAPYAAVPASVPPPPGRGIVHVRTTEAPVSNQAAILAAYVSHVRQLRIDPAAAAAPGSSEPLKVSGISIERIAIEPLPKLEAIAGERQ